MKFSIAPLRTSLEKQTRPLLMTASIAGLQRYNNIIVLLTIMSGWPTLSWGQEKRVLSSLWNLKGISHEEQRQAVPISVSAAGPEAAVSSSSSSFLVDLHWAGIERGMGEPRWAMDAGVWWRETEGCYGPAQRVLGGCCEAADFHDEFTFPSSQCS